MRFLVLINAVMMFVGCATTSSSGAAFQSRLPAMETIVKAARAEAWGAELKQIPATVIEVGELASVPYLSFAGKDVELNFYGDPTSPAGIEIGTRSESAEFRAALRAFVGNLLSEADRKPLGALPEGTEVVTEGLALEITLPTAADGFGAWWVTAFHPVGIQGAKASVGEMNELARAPVEESNEMMAFPDVGGHPGFYKYPRFRPTGAKVYATAYFKKDGVYQRRK